MQILDLTCKNCGCNYEVDEMGLNYIIHYQNKNIDTYEIKCPECGSISYLERYFDDPWDKE
jgi:uncharacterized Zn finger protein